MYIREIESSLKKTIYKILIVLFLLIFVSLLISGIIVKNKYFKHKLPTKAIKIEDIKSVHIINMDKAVKRREEYEKMLKNTFGDSFLGKKIGEEIRLPATNGKQDLVFENINTKEKITYNDILQHNQGKLTMESFKWFENGIFKVYDKNYEELSLYAGIIPSSPFICGEHCRNAHIPVLFNRFGIKMSIFRAINQIAKQPKGTYGMIFEDDFFVDNKFYDKMNKILQNVPNDFDMLKLCTTYLLVKNNHQYIVSDRIKLSGKNIKTILKSFKRHGYGDWIILDEYGEMANGNQAFIVSQSGAEKIIDFYKNNISSFFGTDIELWYTMPVQNQIRNYVYIKNVPVELSDQANYSQINPELIKYLKK